MESLLKIKKPVLQPVLYVLLEPLLQHHKLLLLAQKRLRQWLQY